MSTLPSPLRPNPYVHVEPDSLYNPLSDLTLRPGDPLYAPARHLFAENLGAIDRADIESLRSAGWAVDRDDLSLSRQHHLKVVSLETNSVCNQACYFCPVSIAPREDAEMSDALFHNILGQLGAWRSTLEGVFLQSYNEPTIDLRFVEHCRAITEAGLPTAVLSNGSGLTPAKVDAILAFGGIRYLCVNLSTLDADRYKHDRGANHLPVVLRNLDYLRDRPFAAEMRIVVLGTGDEIHRKDYEEIAARFAGSRFSVEHHVVMDRAGYLEIGMRPSSRLRRLRGCDNLGSRPIQHLHITPKGRCVLCCEDYDEAYVVGDLSVSSVEEVLSGPELARFRRWIYGVEEAPEDFICRNCIFARSG